MLLFITYTIICAGVLSMLTGCDTLKYAGCIARDNTSHPCQ